MALTLFRDCGIFEVAMDEEAERLYNAVMKTLSETGMIGLLAAAADAKSKLSWEAASSKTRGVFQRLAANLTGKPGTA